MVRDFAALCYFASTRKKKASENKPETTDKVSASKLGLLLSLVQLQ